MKFTVPFEYQAKFVLKGKRSPNNASFRGAVTVDVREVSPEEAPVAFIVADTAVSDGKLSPKNGRPRRVLSYEGRFWRETLDADRLRELLVPVFPNGAAWQASMVDNPFACGEWLGVSTCPDFADTRRMEGRNVPAPTNRAEVEAIQDRPVRSWEDDGGEFARACIRSATGAIIAVDGSLFEKCLEPVWKVSLIEKEVVVSLDLVDTETDIERRTSYSAPHLFTLERMRDAVECAREMATLRYPPAERVRIVAKARVLDPSAPTFPDDLMALQYAAESAMTHLRSNLATAPEDAGMAWIELRDAMLESDGFVTPRVADAVGAVSKTWADKTWRNENKLDDDDIAIGNNLYGHHKSMVAGWAHMHSGDGPSAALEACYLAHRRWERRPDDAREWIHLSSGAPITVNNEIDASEILTKDEARRAAKTLGLDLEEEIVAANAGTIRLLVAREGNHLLAVAVSDLDGNVERVSGGHRTPSAAVDETLRNHAATVAMAIAAENFSAPALS